MTDQSDQLLGFCQSCGAKRIIVGQSHCASCGQNLLQPSEITLGPVPAVVAAATQLAPEVQAVPAAPVAPAMPVAPAPAPVAIPIPEQPMAPPEPLAPAFLPASPPPASSTAPTAPPPWATTAPGDAAATPPAVHPPPPPAEEDAATSPAVRRRRFPLPLLIGIGLAAVVAIAGGVYFVASSKPGHPIITVSGVELEVASVQLTDSYGSGSETIDPGSTADTFLVVKCDVVSSNVGTARVSWDVSVTADKGSIVTPSVTEQTSEAGQLKGVAWVFVVAKTAQSFVLNFPDGQTVKLDSLVTSSGPSASP